MSERHLPGPLRIGERYKNKYDILELLGAGGQGAVYRAHHCLKKQDVAIKVVAGRDPEAMIRGAREVESLARLNHPNIPALFDAEIDDGFLVLVMEYLKGRPYKAALKEHGRLGVQEVLELSIQAAEALAFMHEHEHGVIHRDIKPENIYIATGNQVKILDFGIAKVEDEKAKTQRNIVLGTRPYVAPEQLLGLPVSPFSDQFALGVVEYIALGGIHPIDQVLLARGEAPNAKNRMEIQCLEMPAPLHVLDPEIDLYVSQMVQRSIAKQPSQRFASVRSKLDALRECLRLYLQGDRHRRRPVVRDLSVPGNVPLVRPSAERRQAGAAQQQLDSAGISAERDPQPPASLQSPGAGHTEPLKPLVVQPARQVKSSSWLTDDQQDSAVPDPNIYGPKGTLRVAPPPAAKLWAAEMLAPEKAHVLAEVPGRSTASAGSAAPPREPQVPLRRAHSAPLASAKGIRRLPEEKPRTPPPVTVGVGKHQIRWSSVRPLFAVGLAIGTGATSLMVAVMWGISWMEHRAPAPATASLSEVITPSVTQHASEAPAQPSSSSASAASAQVPLPAATTPPATVVSNSQLTKAASTGIASNSSKPPAGLSSSQRAHQSEVARMRERMNDLEKDLKDSKGANSPW